MRHQPLITAYDILQTIRPQQLSHNFKHIATKNSDNLPFLFCDVMGWLSWEAAGEGLAWVPNIDW